MPSPSATALPLRAAIAKPGTEQLRRHNLAVVLTALRAAGALSHTEISERTGLASATVTAVTADLERLGAIERREQAGSGNRGRPRVHFARRRDFSHVVAVQISSDQLHYALADYGGTMIDRFSRPRTIVEGTPEGLVAEIEEAIARLSQRSRIGASQIGAISLSSKGMVDAEAGRLVWSPVFGERNVDFSPLVAACPSASLFVSNETLLVAHAAARRRILSVPDKAAAGLIALSLGHSIGLGIARPGGGELRELPGLSGLPGLPGLSGLSSLPGLNVSAPNFGHMLNALDDRLCRCGSRGCIEATAGFYGILMLAFQVPPNTIPAKFVPLTEMDKIAASARQGARMAQYAFRQAGLALGQGLSRVLSLYENMPVVVTGPGTRFYDLLSAGMVEGLRQSLQVRLTGLPDIEVLANEAELVFDGHVDRALSSVDLKIASLR